MDINEIIHTVFTDGVLLNYIPDYEYRAIQEQMADAIIAAWYDEKHCIIEAGTGTGKTLGYLLPAALFAMYENVKVAIVTETKALQQQLMLNDLPIIANTIRDITGTSLTYALCLGSNNYPCYRRLQNAIDTGSFDKSKEKEIYRVHEVVTKQPALTRFDIMASESLWHTICRESQLCPIHTCKYKNRCSYILAKKNWQEANILVMNHYLFFSNIAASKSLVPDFKVVVFDEAHSIERIASNQLGFAINTDVLKETIEHIIRRRKGGALIERVLTYDMISEAMEVFDNALRQVQLSKKILNDIVKNLQTLRLRNPLAECLPLLKALEEVLRLFEKAEPETMDEDLRLEYEYHKASIMDTWHDLGMAVFMDEEKYVYWLEKEKNSQVNIFICGQPLDVASIIHKEVADYYDHCCFVSGTLSVNNSFDYFKQSIGCDNADTLILSSPFNFTTQSVLFIDTNDIDPNSEEFIDASVARLTFIVNMVKGRCLVLFTSYTMLIRVYEKMHTTIPYEIFSQHRVNASTILHEYIKCSNGILFGTHSFWQGIDLPGDLVRAVIIMKLPFEAPDSPVVQAKIEKIQKEGGNPFMKYQLPYAVLLLKQGFGRLIRKSTDKGVVAILDSRIVTKAYGKIFLASLPDAKKVYTLEELEKAYTAMVM